MQMERDILNTEEFLSLVNEFALDKDENQDTWSFVQFLNVWLCLADQKEMVISTGSTVEGTKIRLGEEVGDVDLMLISGQGVIPESCMEFLPSCPAFLCINGTNLSKEFKSMPLINMRYLPSSFLKNLHKQSFGILRGIISILTTSSVASDGKISFMNESSVGNEQNVVTGINPEFLGLMPLPRDNEKTLDTMGRTVSELVRKMEVKTGIKHKDNTSFSAFDELLWDFIENEKKLIKCSKDNVPLSILSFVAKTAFSFYIKTSQLISSDEESETDSEVEPISEDGSQVPLRPKVGIDELPLNKNKTNGRDLGKTDGYSETNSVSSDIEFSSEEETHNSRYYNDLDESSETEEITLSENVPQNTETELLYERSSAKIDIKHESKERVKSAPEPVAQVLHDFNTLHFSDDSRISAFYKKMSSTDFVPALKCSGWPSPAVGWLTRPRLWPSERLVREIFQLGFHVVAKAPPVCVVLKDGNVTDEKYFRLSFSAAEILLFQNMSTWQRQCLRVLKAYQKGMLQTDTKILTSYHWKTTILWLSEKKEPSFWNEINLMSSVIEALNDMVGYLSMKCLPHYFVPEMNLLMGCNRDEYKILEARIKCICECPIEALRKCITQPEITKKHIIISGKNIDRLRQISQETDGSSVMKAFKDDLCEEFMDGIASEKLNPFSKRSVRRGLNLAFEELQTFAKYKLMKKDTSQSKMETISKILGDVSSCISNILPADDSTTDVNQRSDEDSTEDSSDDEKTKMKLRANVTSLLGTVTSVIFSSKDKDYPVASTPRKKSKNANVEQADIELD
ncbi:hypothetical protein ACJMK2_020179 [Sinanodonta woodiana]|uniref:Protein MB21D2 n=1 Tax=Sinanodonta woodiana TaxID=1069815 RepID=A0ABD3U006_SINWO